MMKTIVSKVLVGLLSTAVVAGGTAGVTYLVENVQSESIVAESQISDEGQAAIAEVQTDENKQDTVAQTDTKQTSGTDKAAVVEIGTVGIGNANENTDFSQSTTVSVQNATVSEQKTDDTVVSTNRTGPEQKVDNIEEKAAEEKAAEEKAAEEKAVEEKAVEEKAAAEKAAAEKAAEEKAVVEKAVAEKAAEEKAAAEKDNFEVTFTYNCFRCGRSFQMHSNDEISAHVDSCNPNVAAEQAAEQEADEEIDLTPQEHHDCECGFGTDNSDEWAAHKAKVHWHCNCGFRTDSYETLCDHIFNALISGSTDPHNYGSY